MLNGVTLVQRILAARRATPDEIIPCTEEDLREVARYAPGPLPMAYLDFLYAIGRGAGDFLSDQDIYYPRIFDLHHDANVVLDNEGGPRLTLPADAFVFSVRNLEQFLFFHADGQADNPRIYHYIDSQLRFRPAGTFWDFVEEELAICENLAREFPNSPWLR
jgi:hypothetical protein